MAIGGIAEIGEGLQKRPVYGDEQRQKRNWSQVVKGTRDVVVGATTALLGAGTAYIAHKGAQDARAESIAPPPPNA